MSEALIHGQTPLYWAASNGNLAEVQRLIEALPFAQRDAAMRDALKATESGTVARWLLQAGADPSVLNASAQREIVGLPAEPDDVPFAATREQFERGRHVRFGTSNPERIDEPFWHMMIRSMAWAWTPRRLFLGEDDLDGPPIFCGMRWGQSITFVPDGRIVQIGGEHEDWYDPDFCIYNDVWLHEPDGTIAIFGYPLDVFPRTDFHSATLVDDAIYVIGSISYPEERLPGTTPVYRLDTRTFAMSRVEIAGTPPGWISRHRAQYDANTSVIRLSGGKIHDAAAGFIDWAGTAELDLRTMAWR